MPGVRRPFDESKVVRHPAGTSRGGEFAVKANGAGRFEVVGPNGKKVAESTSEAEAQDLARNRNIEVSKAAQISEMTDADLRALMNRRDADAHRFLVDEKDMGNYHLAKQDARLAGDELTRRELAGFEPEARIVEEINAIDVAAGKPPGRDSGYVGVTPVRKRIDGTWEVYQRDRHSSSQTFTKFEGSKDDVARYAQRELEQRRESKTRMARWQADVQTVGIDTTGRPSLHGQFSKIPNEWAIEQGYAEPATITPSTSVGRYGYDGPSPGEIQTIKWKPGINPEAVLVHYLSGTKPPENFPVGSEAWEEWQYGRNLPPGASAEVKAAMKKLRGKNKAEREAIVRRIAASALAACGFVVQPPSFEESLIAACMEAIPNPGEATAVVSNIYYPPHPAEQQIVDALVAAVEIPVHPPRSFFEKPRELRRGAPTITADGRFATYLATWDSCHMGEPGGPGVCVSPPKSGTNYALFHLGELETAEGDLIPVGKITLGTGHASLQASRNAAAAHYDNTGTVVADVRAGEDEVGIWVAGALRPGTTPAQIRALRAAQLSGDWRRYRNALDLVAALAVNVPGFPIPRVAALVAPELEGDDRMSLVAAGVVEPLPMSPLEVDARMDALGVLAGVAEL